MIGFGEFFESAACRNGALFCDYLGLGIEDAQDFVLFWERIE
jgi:hypothetical protein